MAASGRKQPLDFADFGLIERPLLVKADIQPRTAETGWPNGWYTPESCHSAKLGLNGKK